MYRPSRIHSRLHDRTRTRRVGAAAMSHVNRNLSFDRVFARIGQACKPDAIPETMDPASLAREFERVANELRVAPPDNLYSATGHTFTVEMLERARDICGGLAALPGAAKDLEKLGKMRGRR